MWFSVDRIEAGPDPADRRVVLVDDEEKTYALDAAAYLSLTGREPVERDVLDGDAAEGVITRLSFSEEETNRRLAAARARMSRLRARRRR